MLWDGCVYCSGVGSCTARGVGWHGGNSDGIEGGDGEGSRAVASEHLTPFVLIYLGFELATLLKSGVFPPWVSTL